MDGYEVLLDELAAHASKIDGLTDRLRTAVNAAITVTMDNSAYGVVCQPFASRLQPFEELGVRTLSQSAEALTDTAKKVRDTVSRPLPELVTPPVVGGLGDLQLPADISHILAVGQQLIGLGQLPHNLLRGMPLPRRLGR